MTGMDWLNRWFGRASLRQLGGFWARRPKNVRHLNSVRLRFLRLQPSFEAL